MDLDPRRELLTSFSFIEYPLTLSFPYHSLFEARVEMTENMHDSKPSSVVIDVPPYAMTRMLATVGAGALFGAALASSGVYLPSVIVSQMQMKDYHMLKVFLTASGSSA